MEKTIIKEWENKEDLIEKIIYFYRKINCESEYCNYYCGNCTEFANELLYLLTSTQLIKIFMNLKERLNIVKKLKLKIEELGDIVYSGKKYSEKYKKECQKEQFKLNDILDDIRNINCHDGKFELKI